MNATALYGIESLKHDTAELYNRRSRGQMIKTVTLIEADRVLAAARARVFNSDVECFERMVGEDHWRPATSQRVALFASQLRDVIADDPRNRAAQHLRSIGGTIGHYIETIRPEDFFQRRQHRQTREAMLDCLSEHGIYLGMSLRFDREAVKASPGSFMDADLAYFGLGPRLLRVVRPRTGTVRGLLEHPSLLNIFAGDTQKADRVRKAMGEYGFKLREPDCRSIDDWFLG